jgi:hypothetical protein
MKKYIVFKYASILFFATISLGSIAQKQQQKLNITNFTVSESQNKVSINWSTDNKVPTNYFEVEKSIDGKAFKTVAYVLGADPSKTNCDCYGFFDKVSPAKKVSFYRLKHVNEDGNVELSDIKRLF